MTHRSHARGAAAALMAIFATTNARGDDIDDCSSAHAAAQRLFRSGKLVEARAEDATCSRAVCPKAIAMDCEEFLHETDQAMPTVVFVARDAQNRDIADVRVTVDGSPATTRLDGEPLPINPGPHVIRYERIDGAASPAVENRILVAAGEKNRSLLVQFGQTPSPTMVPVQVTRPLPLAFWVLGGVGTLGVATAAVAGVKTLADLSSDKSACGTSCGGAEQQRINTEAVVSDVAAAVGVVGVAAAIWVFVARPRVTAPVQVDVVGGARGFGFTVSAPL